MFTALPRSLLGYFLQDLGSPRSLDMFSKLKMQTRQERLGQRKPGSCGGIGKGESEKVLEMERNLIINSKKRKYLKIKPLIMDYSD